MEPLANLFEAQTRLSAKTRVGASLQRRHDTPRTPIARTVDYYRDRRRKIPPAALEWLALRRELDPFVVSSQLDHAVEQLLARRRRAA